MPRSPRRPQHRGGGRTTTDQVHMGHGGRSYKITATHKGTFPKIGTSGPIMGWTMSLTAQNQRYSQEHQSQIPAGRQHMVRKFSLALGIVAALMLPSETFAKHGGGGHGGGRHMHAGGHGHGGRGHMHGGHGRPSHAHHGPSHGHGHGHPSHGHAHHGHNGRWHTGRWYSGNGRWWRGHWYGYGVGACWSFRPAIGWVWVCY